jgi:hypothetical protein
VPASKPSRPEAHGLFNWVTKGRRDARDGEYLIKPARWYNRQWEAIKRSDCAAYRAPRCEARLDAALRTATDKVLKVGRRYYYGQ